MDNNQSVSLYDELSERIVVSPDYALYDRLVHASILEDLKLLQGTNTLSPTEINTLLKFASIFACSTQDRFKQIAYSIAILCFDKLKHTNPEISNIASVLLIRLGNFPAYTLVERSAGEKLDIEATVPLILQMETTAKSLSNKIELNNKDIYLTDFQRELFDTLSSSSDCSFAAPTSAGKSFLLNIFIVDQLRKEGKMNIVYIVPTKALINQVKNDLKNNLPSFGITDVRILSSTVSFEFEDLYEEVKQDKHILILTQERLSAFLSKRHLDFAIDYLIVDEAQKINDGNRGVILERAISQTIARFPLCKAIFSAPLASNPEFFARYKPTVTDKKTNYSPVHQNVMFVNTTRKQPFLTLLSATEQVILESSEIQKGAPTTDKAKLAYIAYHLGVGKSNILYANGPADTENLAYELCKYLPDVEHPKITAFSTFIQQEIHKDYTLIYCLKKGVVFHYSTMPRELKEQIEELFRDESIPVNFLCCTSTLLEGMNLPARNVFIHKPTKGDKNKMNKFDFWNLAGRAGRLLKDFYGNIFCLNVENWGEDSYKPDRSIENYTIVSATEGSISAKSEEFTAYLENIQTTLPLKERELLEQTASTFVLSYITNTQNTVSHYSSARGIETTTSTLEKIDQQIKTIAEKNRLPIDVLEKNSGVDPRLQNNLLNYFQNTFYPVLLPKYPAGPEFYSTLESIFQVINKIFLADADSKILRRYVYVADKWISETPVGELIDSQIKWEESNEKFKTVNSCVRTVVDLIDRTITFKYAKYLKCYNDILEYHLKLIGVEENVINLSAYIELGAYRKTTLSLLSFGLSRTTAISLRKIIGNSDMDRAACRQWLTAFYERNKSDLAPVCQEDFERNFE